MRIPITLLATVAALLAPAAAAHAVAEVPSDATVGIFGDTPYGAAHVANFPNDIDALNADPDLDWTIHVGDIKSGSTQCTDAYFAQIKAQFDRLEDPLVYTPGDNEWTDCHRTNNGAYNPLERLQKIRDVFFPIPSRTLGKSVKITTESWKGVPENRLWTVENSVLATLHVVGSNDSLLPWDGLGETAPTAAQQAEHDARLAANLQWIKKAFYTARSTNANAVVLAMQADMWDTFAIAAGANTAFAPIVEEVAKQARFFGKPVLLVNGDSHVFVEDAPLATKTAAYPNAIVAPNLTRITVQGSSTTPREFVKLKITDSAADPLSWTSKAFSAPAS